MLFSALETERILTASF